jgi:hypothetical protein
VIEVFLGALFLRKMRKVFIIMILLEHQNAFRGQNGNNTLRDSSLARSGAATDPNDQSLRHDHPSRIMSATFCRRADLRQRGH